MCRLSRDGSSVGCPALKSQDLFSILLQHSSKPSIVFCLYLFMCV